MYKLYVEYAAQQRLESTSAGVVQFSMYKLYVEYAANGHQTEATQHKRC
jgi:hypothetical protein